MKARDPNAVLAELLGWEYQDGSFVWGSTSETWRANVPAYDTDLNAMAEVWKVLWEKELWYEFWITWRRDTKEEIRHPPSMGWYSATYHFLTDPKGQVKAAIQVLAKGGD